MVNFNDPMYGFAPRMSVPSYSTAPPPAAFAPSVAPMPQQQPRGLLGMLGLGNTGLGGFVDSRRARLAAFGAGLASGRTLGEGLALGAQGAAGARQVDVENASNQQKLSKTREWFQKMSASDPFYADLMQAIDAGMPMQDAWAAAMKHQTGEGGSTYGKEITWGRDESGNWVAMQAGSRGDITRSQLPEGVTPVPPGDIRSAQAAGSAEGKSQGEAVALYKSMVSKMPSLQSTVAQLEQLAETATYTQVGQWRDQVRRETGQDPTPEAIARAQYIATIDNVILPLLRDTFGAQFTENEGKALRATLGDPNMSPAEKKAVLKSFIDQKKYTIEALARQTGMPMPTWDEPSAPPAGGGGDIDALMRKYDY